MTTCEQVYAKFGLTAEAAQLFETELGTILLAREGEERGWHVNANPEQAAEFYEKLSPSAFWLLHTGSAAAAGLIILALWKPLNRVLIEGARHEALPEGRL